MRQKVGYVVGVLGIILLGMVAAALVTNAMGAPAQDCIRFYDPTIKQWVTICP